MKKFKTKWSEKLHHGEVMSEDTLTESKGYIPPKKQIENLIQAGKRLVAWRKEQYDFPDESSVDVEFEDPTRSAGYDIVDAGRDLQRAEAGLRKAGKAGAKTPPSDTAGAVKIDPEASSEGKEPKNEKA